MTSEHSRRRRSKRRWTAFVVAYWIVLIGGALWGFDALITSEHALGTKWLIGIVGGLIAGLMVHWGTIQTVALRE